MNFQAVAAANGQNIIMVAEVLEIGNTRQTNKGKNCQSNKLKDSNGEVHAVTIHQGNGQLLMNNHMMTRQQFSLSTYQSQQGGIAYSGFWNDKAQVSQQQPPQQQQQQQQQQRYVPVQDTKNLSIERQCCIKAAVEYAQGKEWSPAEVIAAAACFHEFVQKGTPLPVVQVQDDRDYSDGNPDNIPWDGPMEDSGEPPF